MRLIVMIHIQKLHCKWMSNKGQQDVFGRLPFRFLVKIVVAGLCKSTSRSYFGILKISVFRHVLKYAPSIQVCSLPSLRTGEKKILGW